MTCAGSMQFSRESRIYSSHGCSSQHSSITGKGRLQFVNINISSNNSLRQDAWNLHLLSSIHGPISPVPSRCNIFLCRSVLTPGGGYEIPVLKSAAVVLTRSYTALRGWPLVLKLIPAVGIIAFATWGLGPLVQFGRNIFSQKSDANSKKSSTQHLISSYFQPLLLWTGAMLICRALDPVVLPSEASQVVKQRLLNFMRSLSTVLAFAYCLSSLIQQAQQFLAETSDSGDTQNMGFGFAAKAVYSAVWIAAVSLFMELLGFSTQKWLTAGGLGTVLLTLAGREIFTNFLSSVMIHATRPFVKNEWIQTKIEGYEVSGTVEHVGWWSPTIIRGDDREAVHIPNHKFTVSVVRNLSQKTHWRIKTHLAISHLDVNKINNIVADMRKVLAKNPQIEQQRLHRRVFLDKIDPENQALNILVSCFVKTSHFEEYLRVKEVVFLDLLRVISHHRARLATPIRTIRKIYNEGDLENIPFADSAFSSPGAPANRPLLLIEPSYRINGDGKVKPSTHSNEVKDVQAEAAASTSESKGDANFGSAPNIDTKVDIATARPFSDSNTNPKVATMLSPDSELRNSVPNHAVQNNGSAKDAWIEPVDRSSDDTTWEAPNKSLVTKKESDSARGDIPSSVPQAKQDAEKPLASPSLSRPPLEENIVLGVALEGSKLTLPIEEEETTSSPFPAEAKELASSRNGSGPPSIKEKKDGQMPTIPSSSQND